MRLNRSSRESTIGLLLVSPWLIGFIFFFVGPILASLVLSFTEWDLLTSPTWIGFENYQRMLEDRFFWESISVTFGYALGSIPLTLLLGFLAALLVNREWKGLGLFRSALYLPEVIGTIPMSIVWFWVLNPNYGLINSALRLVGINGPLWLADERWVLPGLVIMGLWEFGGAMLVFLASLQDIPSELYECAWLDGANHWQAFLHITLPMLKPTFYFALAIGISSAFQIFAPGLVITNGGPNNASLFYALYLYRNAFSYFRMSYACALAWFAFFVALVPLVLLLKSQKWVDYERQP